MILVKTEAGHQVLKDRSIRLTARQRSAFILFDGKRSVAEVLAAGTGTAPEEIEQMVDLGLLGPLGETQEAVGCQIAGSLESDVGVDTQGVQPAVAVMSDVRPATTAPPRSSQQRYQDGYQVATRLTAGLGLRGFRLNLAVEGSSSYEQLRALAPKIRAAVGPEKAAMLDRALDD